MTNVTIENFGKPTSRLYERVVSDNKFEQRFYKDAFYTAHPNPPWMPKGHTTRIWRNNGLLLEEKMSKTNNGPNNKYAYNVMLQRNSNGPLYRNSPNGTYGNFWNTFSNLHWSLDNQGPITKFQLGLINKGRNTETGDLAVWSDDRINIEMNSCRDEMDDCKMKLSYNNERIFDGWFYLTRMLQAYARQQLPAMFERGFKQLVEFHNEKLRFLTEYV